MWQCMYIIVVFFLFPGLLVRLAFSSVTQPMPFLVNTSQQCKPIFQGVCVLGEGESVQVCVCLRVYMCIPVCLCVWYAWWVHKPSINHQNHFSAVTAYWVLWSLSCWSSNCICFETSNLQILVLSFDNTRRLFLVIDTPSLRFALIRWLGCTTALSFLTLFVHVPLSWFPRDFFLFISF